MSSDLSFKRLRRLRLLFAGFAGLALVLVLALAYWQILPGERPETWMSEEETGYRTRGSILDCDGHYLALDAVVYEVDAYPNQITVTKTLTGAVALVDDLAAILDVDSDRVLQRFMERENRQIILGTFVDADTGRRIEELGYAGIHLEPSYIRYYPEEELFGPVVGLTRWLSVTGVSGIEGYYKAELTGRDPKGWEGFSASGTAEIGDGEEGRREGPGKPPRIADLPQVADGADLYTTLDRNVQRIAYDALAYGVNRSGAERGLVIVMEPATGKVRAVINYPSFDPNRYPEYWPDRSANLIDHSVRGTYEPGSVVKMMTVAAGVNEGLITAGTTFHDTGEITIGTETLYNLGERAYGTVNTVEVLAHSLNVEAVAIAKMLQPAVFYDYMRRFGFGESTRIDLAGESPGELRVPGEPKWNLSDLGTNSYGQGVTVTPMLVVAAVSAVANGGRRMQPYVVERIVRGHDETIREPQVACAEVISRDTAEEVSRMLAQAVEMSIPKAKVPGYTVAGKSGTSQVVIGGQYHPTRTIASFAGFAPAEDPRFAILVKLDTPRTSEFGAVVAAPVFSRVAEDLFQYYGIPPTSVRRS